MAASQLSGIASSACTQLVNHVEVPSREPSQNLLNEEDGDGSDERGEEVGGVRVKRQERSG